MLELLRSLFGRRPPSPSADLGAELDLGGRECELTPLFANLVGYVGIAEQVPLARLPTLMNAYFTACTDEIAAEGGTIDKFVGDAIVAMFGAPQALPDHALRACLAALRCQHAVAQLRARLQADPEPWPDRVRNLSTRIGLHTGNVIVGNMGTRSRFNYTMMGDNVNLAARLEAGAKSYAVSILCSDATQAACECAAPGRILFRPLGRIVVIGRAQPVELFEPVALREDATPQAHECVAAFAAGLVHFHRGDWPGAIAWFEKSAPLEMQQPTADSTGLVNPSLRFIDRARRAANGAGTTPPFA